MIEVYADLNPIIKRLTKLGGKINTPTDFLDEVGQYFITKTEQGFKREIDPYGKKWQPLSPATISEKQRLGYPLKILTRTGRMRSSPRYVLQGKAVKIIVDFPGQFHQSGTRRMPKRQILPDGNLSRTDERNIVDLAIDYLED